MARFEFKFEDDFVWVDAADIRRFPQLEHFYMVDNRPYAEKLIKDNDIDHIINNHFKIVRGYFENGTLYISSKDKLYPISKPKLYQKVYIYKKPIKSKRNETVEI